MWGSTIFLTFLASILSIVAYMRNPHSIIEGFRNAGDIAYTSMIRMLPAFIVAGMIQVVLPREFISKWVGAGSGMKGIFIATLAGAITPGGPYSQFPIVASLYEAGAGIEPLVAYLTAWSVLGFNRLITWEFPLLGPKIALVRFAASIFLPFIAAGLTRLIMRISYL